MRRKAVTADLYLPKISIVTPSFNQGHFIEQTICSVLDQGYPNLEYIIIDGGSSDNTVEIIKKYRKYIKYWISERDNGQSHAINKGFKVATGEIINWLNSDDYYYPGCLNHVAARFNNPNINAYCGKSRSFNNVSEYFNQGTDIYIDNLAKTIGWARIDQPETFFRKSAIDQIGFLNEELHFVMDKDLWIRYLLNFGLDNIFVDDQLLVNFRLHEASKSVSLQEKFSIETRDLYFTYSVKNQQDYFTDLFRRYFNVNEIPLTYSFNSNGIIEWKYIFNYFFFKEGLELYAANNFKSSKRILNLINEEFLNLEDKKLLKSIKFRLKVLNPFMKKILNNLK